MCWETVRVVVGGHRRHRRGPSRPTCRTRRSYGLRRSFGRLPSRVGQRAAIGMATKAARPPGARTHWRGGGAARRRRWTRSATRRCLSATLRLRWQRRSSSCPRAQGPVCPACAVEGAGRLCVFLKAEGEGTPALSKWLARHSCTIETLIIRVAQGPVYPACNRSPRALIFT